MRTCVACGLKTAKRDLLRVVHTPEGSVKIDAQGRQNGRGAYVCTLCGSSPESLSRGRLEHSLRTRIRDDEWQGLLDDLANQG